MSDIKVAIMMGSKNDASVLEAAAKILNDFGIANEMRVLSAHRTPQEVIEYVENLPSRGAQVVIAGAGGSAALAGVVAAHTTLPVVGVPIDSMGLGGLDALLSTVQMPPGVPVGGVAIGKAGARNAALLALRIMALSDEGIRTKLVEYRETQRKTILDTKL